MLRYFGPRPRRSRPRRSRSSPAPTVSTWSCSSPSVRDQIVAVGEYHREPGHDEAEVAFLVDDASQGHGIGTILLEHLASEARRHGIRRFVANTLAENHKMLRVFSDAGFVRQYQRDAEVVRVVLDIEPSPEALAAADARDRMAIVRSMAVLLEPGSIAVIGAGRQRGTIGHELLAQPAGRADSRVPCTP